MLQILFLLCLFSHCFSKGLMWKNTMDFCHVVGFAGLSVRRVWGFCAEKCLLLIVMCHQNAGFLSAPIGTVQVISQPFRSQRLSLQTAHDRHFIIDFISPNYLLLTSLIWASFATGKHSSNNKMTIYTAQNEQAEYNLCKTPLPQQLICFALFLRL